MVVRVEWHSNETVERGRGKSKSLRCLIWRPEDSPKAPDSSAYWFQHRLVGRMGPSQLGVIEGKGGSKAGFWRED